MVEKKEEKCSESELNRIEISAESLRVELRDIYQNVHEILILLKEGPNVPISVFEDETKTRARTEPRLDDLNIVINDICKGKHCDNIRLGLIDIKNMIR